MAKFNAGDRVMVKCTVGLYEGKATVHSEDFSGYFLKTDGPHLGNRGDGLLWSPERDLTLIEEPKPKTEKRHAKVGERILIVNDCGHVSGQNYGVGDVLTVTKEDVISKGDVHVAEQPGFIDNAEYEVIVEEAPEKTHGKKVKVGDKVRVVAPYMTFGNYKLGEVLTVKNIDVDEGYFHAKEHGLVMNEDEVEVITEELAPKPAPKQTKLNEGDTAKVVARKNGHRFEIGEIVRIVMAREGSNDYKAETLDGKDYWFVRDEELDPLPKTKSAKFQAGDIVFVSEGSNEFYGEVIDGPRGPLSGGNYDIDTGSKVRVILGDNLTMIAPKDNRVD